MATQFDRKLLREVNEWRNERYKTDELVKLATPEALWGALACLDETEFAAVKRDNQSFERKCRTELEIRGQLNAAILKELEESRTQRRFLLGVLVTLAVTLVGIIFALLNR